MTGRLSFFIAVSVLLHGMLLLSGPPPAVPSLGHERQVPVTVNMTAEKTGAQTAAPPEAVASNPVPAPPDIEEVPEPPVMTARQAPVPPPAAVEQPAPPVTRSKPDDDRLAPDPAPSASEIEARAYSELTRQMSRHFHYPLLARKRGWQGKVELSVHVGRGGLIGDIQVVDSSGYRLLDHAAVRSLQQISYLSAAADWRLPQGFDMVVPVEYRLIDG